jgi:hypothetical protein
MLCPYPDTTGVDWSITFDAAHKWIEGAFVSKLWHLVAATPAKLTDFF